METTERTTLPQNILASLYKNVLIAQLDNKAEEETGEVIPVQSKRLVVLIRCVGDAIPETELAFLANIMNACKLKKADYVAVPVKPGSPENYLNIQAKFESPFVLLFGLTPAAVELPINFPAFQLQSFQACRYLAAPSLDEIEKDKSLKLQLWQCLKEIFP